MTKFKRYTVETAKADATTTVRLSDPQRDLLWIIAQHKYGWAHCPRHDAGHRFQVAQALARRGLVEITDDGNPRCSATPLGRAEIERRFPVSPFALGTYDHQPGGWTPRHGVVEPEAARA
jgi:hypothetical protein